MTDTSVRDRLARALHTHRDNQFPARVRVPWNDPSLRGQIRDRCRAEIDAILSELAEPSEGMLMAGDGHSADGPYAMTQTWRAMIQHIRDGGS